VRDELFELTTTSVNNEIYPSYILIAICTCPPCPPLEEGGTGGPWPPDPHWPPGGQVLAGCHPCHVIQAPPWICILPMCLLDGLSSCDLHKKKQLLVTL
jgi:hypothetical protein